MRSASVRTRKTHQGACSARRVFHRDNAATVDFAEQVLSHDVTGGPGSAHGSAREQNNFIGIVCGQIEIVEND